MITRAGFPTAAMPKRIKKLECPIHWKPLEAFEIEVPGLDIHADRCPECQGIFLDKGEIKRLTGGEKLNDLFTKHLGIDSDSQRLCPSCGMVMDMEDADGVRVDVCLSCFGVWLDAGELEALKGKPDASFDPKKFSPEKQKEVARAQTVAKADRKRWWKLFMWRLTGQDLMKRPPPK
jgi:Zn-finger nucleic acid-binding protein